MKCCVVCLWSCVFLGEACEAVWSILARSSMESMMGLLAVLFVTFYGSTTTSGQVSMAVCNGDFDFYLLIDTYVG